MTEPIVILGPEQARLDASRADGGLPPLAGVANFGVFRASRDTRPDALGYTYHHHVDIACWKGKLYVGWNTCLKDEDLWPSRELLSVSDDGEHWSDPLEMFPQGVSTPLRMYFYRAPTDRMLLIAGLRPDEGETVEDHKHGLVVRELCADHTLGPVFTLQPQGSVVRGPMFHTSPDAGFVDACRTLLADRVYLEQQDRGKLLDNHPSTGRAMKWHDARHWPGGVLPGTKEGEENVKWTFGKALSFFDRPPSEHATAALVGVCKMGWTTLSLDRGHTWSAPLVPATLITGKAKVFAQNHRDGSITLAYNPSTSNRYPLVLVTSRDGIHFTGMRLVQGELPRQRYEGRFRSVGPQYVRGLSKWSDDGSREQRCTWLVYSMNKEDIWVARVPIPTEPDAAGWHVHQPKWARVEIDRDAATLVCADPYDHASVTRCLDAAGQAQPLRLEVTVNALPRDAVSLDVVRAPASTRDNLPTRWVFSPDGSILRDDHPAGAFTSAGTFTPGKPLRLDVGPGVVRFTLRTGVPRNLGGKAPVDPGTDRPAPPIEVTIRLDPTG